MTATTAEAQPAEVAPTGGDPVVEWLLAEGRHIRRSRDLLDALCRRLRESGVPLWRAVLSIRAIHPKILSTVYYWLRDADPVGLDRGYDILDDPAYLKSPFKVIHDGAGALRRRLAGPQARIDFPVLQELKDQGATDYVVMPLAFNDGTINVISWASDAPDGFRVEDLRRIDDLM